MPLAFFVLAAVLLLTLYDATDRRRRRTLPVRTGRRPSGVDEERRIAGPHRRRSDTYRHGMAAARAGSMLRELLARSAGTLPGLAAVVLLKTCLDGNNDLVGGQGWNVWLAG